MENLLVSRSPSLLIARTPRSQRGNFLAEYPVVLLVLFIVLMVPMLNIATIGIRAYFVRSAVLEAVHSAGNCPSFLTNTDAPPNGESAVNRVDRILAAFKNGFRGISFPTPATIEILVQPINGTTEPAHIGNRAVLPINQPPDEEKNQYYVEVTQSSLVEPLISFSGSFFPSIPGMSSPMPLTFSGRQLVERPEGLDQ